MADSTGIAISGVVDAAIDTLSIGPGGRAPSIILRTATQIERIGRYIVVSRLGSGSMGEVYAAYDPELDRKVAVKLLLENPSHDAEDLRQRLFREAQTMARLTHPNVVTVHDVGVADGRVFMAMELSEGTNLRRWQQGKHSWRERVRVYVAAGRGLAAAHVAGVVHRDFKPDNVLVGKGGAVKVTDFGIAHGRQGPGDSPDSSRRGDREAPVSGRSLVDAELTAAGTVMGTPGYMAPEQYTAAATDPRTDQFCFCAALYESLYGEKPFEGSTFESQMYSVLHGRVRPPKRGVRVPAFLRRALLRGLSRSMADRYESMDALLADLTRDRARRVRAVVAVASLCILAIATGTFVQRAAAARDARVCSGAGPLVLEVWNPEAQSAIGAAFHASGVRFADEAWNKAREGLTAYSERWATAHRDACEATRVRGGQTEAAMQLRMTCLEQRRRQLGALARRLASPDAEIIGKAAQAAYSLPDVEACAEVTSLTSTEPLPAAPDARAAIDGMRRELSELRAEAPFGHVDVVLPKLRALDARARISAYAPLEAEVAMELGALLHVAGDPTAVDVYKQAIVAAERGRADDVKVEAESALAHILANRHNFDESRQWLALGRATEAHADKRLDARLWKVEAWLAYEQDHFKESNEAFKRALAAYAEFYPRTPDYALALSGAAHVANLAGDAPRAMELSAASDALAISLFGEGSSFRAGILTNRAALLLETTRYDEALVASEAALTLAAGLPRTQNRVMNAHFNRAEALIGTDAIALARTEVQTEMAALDAADMDTARDDYGRHWKRLNGKILLLSGDYEKARAELQPLVDAKKAADDEGDDGVALALFGEAQLRLKAPADAVKQLRKALEIMGRENITTPARAEETAEAKLLLAEALWDVGSQAEARRMLAAVQDDALPARRKALMAAVRTRFGHPTEP